MRKFILILLCIMFLSMGSFAAYQIYLSLSEYHAGEDTYENLQTYVNIPDNTPDPQTQTETNTPAEYISWPEVNFDELTALNDDIVGWIYLADTHVSYPMVQGEDNAYYLKRMFDGTYNGSGSIFMDFRNARDFSDRNTIFYGHHMINDSMLSDITMYKKQSFYDSHPYMLLMTPEKNYKVEIISGYVATLEDNAWEMYFENDEAYQKWLDTTVSKSAVQCNVKPTTEDKVVTFSTCTYEFEDARYVLVGILREHINPASAETDTMETETTEETTSEA